jgi:hypothetical protein
MTKRISILLLVLVACTSFAHAAATLLLEEPYGDFGAMNPTGHAAVFLSRVCADGGTVLRMCRTGEQGVVISRYRGVAGFDWVAVPLIPYLYAVEHADEVPASADKELVEILRNRYRQEHLKELAPDREDGEPPSGTWVELVGAAYNRKIYGFEIETTSEQDAALIRWLNDRPNRSRFNLFFHNCADFAKGIINFYQPHALRRSYLADVGMTTPKQITKCLVRYAKRHPELDFTTFVIPQVPGATARSTPVHGVLESLVKTKKYAVPLFVFHPWFSTGMFAAYLGTGRFNPQHYAFNTYEPAATPMPMGTE